jgi:hypothetical protein
MSLIIKYNEQEFAIEKGQTLTLYCTGKEMMDNIKAYVDGALRPFDEIMN